MAWSPWLHKAYAEYDRAEARRKRRVNPDYPDSPGTGVGVPFAQTAAILGAGGLDYALYDSSAIDRMWQEATGQTPAANANALGLIIGREKQDRRTFAEVMAAQPELRANYAITQNGNPPTPAVYDSGTGIGTVSRGADFNNAYVLRITVPPTAAILVDIEFVSGTGILDVRHTSGSPTFFSVSSTDRRRKNIALAAGSTIGIQLSTNNATCSFILHSVKEVPAHYASQSVAAQRPVLQSDGLKFDGSDDNLLTDWFAQAGANCIIAQVTVPAVLSAPSLIAGARASAGSRFGLGFQANGTLNAAIGDNATNIASPDFRGQANAIIAVSTDGTMLRAFGDNSQLAAFNHTGSPTGSFACRIGCWNIDNTPAQFFGGSVKRVAFGKTALTLEQFQSIRAEWLAAA